MRLRDRWRSAGTASFPSGLEGIDREFRRQGLRARASSDRVPRKGQGAELPRLSPAHPSTSIRALAFLGSPALAAWTQDLAGELAVSRAGSGARPGTGRTPRPGGDIPARILRSLQCLASPPSGHSYRCSYGHPRIDFNRRCVGVLQSLHYQSNISLCVPSPPSSACRF